MNARVGAKRKGEKVLGNFGIGERNERGNLLIEFARLNGLYILNTFFKKSMKWESPFGGTRNSFHHGRRLIGITQCRRDQPNLGSDHKPVWAEYRIKVEKNGGGRQILIILI